MEIEKRKIEHIELSLRDDVVYKDNCRELYSDIVLIHQAIPGLKPSDINMELSFLNYTLKAPLLIEGMTGGVLIAKNINESLAKLAKRFRIAIGVGSQRPILKYDFKAEIVDTYRVVREIADDVPVIGNIGITQLRELSVEHVRQLVDIIKADALAVHLNPAQEIIQPGGDHDFNKDLYDKLKEILREVDVPVIVKEVGNGLSYEVVKKLRDIGVRLFDTAGACGTSWVKIEALRNHGDIIQREIGLLLYEVGWGIPTPLSLIEARSAAPDGVIIASGGVWNGINAAKLIALGADIVGFARPLLKSLLEGGLDSAEKFIERYIRELAVTMFLTGSTSLMDLRRASIVLGTRIRDYIVQRGINLEEYLSRVRLGVLIDK